MARHSIFRLGSQPGIQIQPSDVNDNEAAAARYFSIEILSPNPAREHCWASFKSRKMPVKGDLLQLRARSADLWTLWERAQCRGSILKHAVIVAVSARIMHIAENALWTEMKVRKTNVKWVYLLLFAIRIKQPCSCWCWQSVNVYTYRYHIAVCRTLQMYRCLRWLMGEVIEVLKILNDD